MALKKALAAAAVSATAAALLISNAGAEDKTASVSQGDLVGNCIVSFIDPSTNRSYLADYCENFDNPTRLYGEDNAALDGLGTFHASGLTDLGTQLAYIQWDEQVNVEANDISTTGFAPAPQPGDTVFFHQPAYPDSPAKDGQGTYVGEINGTYFIDFGEHTGTNEQGTGLLDGTTVWTEDGILGIVDGRVQAQDYPHLALVASPEATGGATDESTQDARFALFDAHFQPEDSAGESPEDDSTDNSQDDDAQDDSQDEGTPKDPQQPGKPANPSESPKADSLPEDLSSLLGSSGSSVSELEDLLSKLR